MAPVMVTRDILSLALRAVLRTVQNGNPAILSGAMGFDGGIWSLTDGFYEVMERQLLTRCSALRQDSACTVKVGFLAPLVPITDAPSIPRFGAS